MHGQIEDWLAGQIAAGALVPGDRLPTEHDLAAWFGVSRMTLRHALAELARRGLVTRTSGRHGGTFVAAPKLEQDLTTLAGFSEQRRRHGMVAGARVLSATLRPAPTRGPASRWNSPVTCSAATAPGSWCEPPSWPAGSDLDERPVGLDRGPVGLDWRPVAGAAWAVWSPR